MADGKYPDVRKLWFANRNHIGFIANDFNRWECSAAITGKGIDTFTVRLI